MSATKIINANEGRRDPLASDRTTVYTDGYKNLFTAGTTPSIADIIAGIGGDPAGTIPMSNVHVPGTDDVMLYVNGQLLLEPGVDFTEVGSQKLLLSAFWLGLITSNPATSKIKVIWNRALPGARDQELNNLRDVDPDLSDGVRDPGLLRAPTNAGNPLATLADIGGGVFPLVGKTIVPVDKSLSTVKSIVPGEFDPYNFLPAPSAPPGSETYLDHRDVDLATLPSPIARPVGATHALVRMFTRLTILPGSASLSGTLSAFAGPYTGTPVATLTASQAFQLASVSEGSDVQVGVGSDADSSYGGLSLVELSPIGSPADFTVLVSLGSTTGFTVPGFSVAEWGCQVEGFLIDEVGRATNPISFSTEGAAGQAVVAGKQQVAFDTTLFNLGSGWNVSTDVFTAPTTGKYLFTGSMGIFNLASVHAGALVLTKNGTAGPGTGVQDIRGSGFNSGNTGDYRTNVSGIFHLDAGDEVELWLDCTVGLPATTSLEASFQGALLGAAAGSYLLEGLTFVPQPQNQRLVANYASGVPVGVSTDVHVDFDSPGGGGAVAVVPPPGATHVVVSAGLGTDGTSAGIGAWTLYGLPYAAGPAPDPHSIMALIRTDVTSEYSPHDTGTRVIELNSPAGAQDLSFHIANTGGVQSPLTLLVSVDGWYIEETASVGASSSFKYFPVVSHSVNSIAQSRSSTSGVGTTGPFTYTLAGFTVTGANFDPTKVVGVFVKMATDNDSIAWNVDFTFPDGTFHALLATAPGPTSVSDENSPGLTTMLPVDPGQVSFDGRIVNLADPAPGSGGDICTYTIIGLWQFG